MRTKLQIVIRLYLGMAILVFGFTAIAKLMSDFSDPRLKVPDPFLWWMSAGHLMLSVALVEIVVVAILIRALLRNPIQGVAVSIWICSLFLVYRAGFALAPENALVCKCFGVGSLLGKMEGNSDLISIILLLTLMGGGFGILLLRNRTHAWRAKSKVARTATLAIATGLNLGAEASSYDAFTPTYIAEGLVTEQMLNAVGRIVSTNNFPFRVAVGADGRWQLSWTYHLPQWKMNCTEHISFDGTNVFSVVYSDKRLGKNLEPIDNLPFESHEHPGRVCRGPFPVDHSSCVGLLWVAFIYGQSDFSPAPSSVPNLLLPNARTSPEAWNTRFAFDRLATTSNSPISSAVFTLDKQSIESDLIHYPEVAEPTTSEGLEATDQEIKRMQRAANDELLRCEYKLNAFEERSSLFIPTQFSAVRYSMIDSLERHFPFIKWEASVTNIITSPQSTQLLPVLQGKINVQDRRFMDRTKSHYVDSVYYLLGEKGWLISTNDVKFQGSFELPVLRRQSPALRKIVFFTIVFLFAGLLGLPVLLYQKRRKAASNRSI